MKKILALIMCVLMLATTFCAVIPASAAVADIKELLGIEQICVGAEQPSNTVKVDDGKISDGEYTYSKVLTNTSRVTLGDFDYMSNSAYNSGYVRRYLSEAGKEQVTLYMAHDSEWVYVAVKGAVGTQVLRSFVITITVPTGDTYGSIMSRINFADNQTVANGKSAEITTYTWGPNTIKVNEDGTNASRGTTGLVRGTDYVQYKAVDADGKNEMTEFKVKKSALMTEFGVSELTNVGVAIVHNKYGDTEYSGANSAYYFCQVVDDDQNALINSTYGSTTSNAWIPSIAYLSATIPTPEEPEAPKTFEEIVNFNNYYVGNKLTTAPTISDGAIGKGEYTFKQTFINSSLADISGNTYLRQTVDTCDATGAGTDSITLHMGYDDDNIYIAIEGRQANTPNANLYQIALTRPNPTTYAEMMDRVTFRFSGTFSVGTTKVTSAAYNMHTTVNADGSRKWNKVDDSTKQYEGSGDLAGYFDPFTAVEAYATLSENNNSLVEVKVSKDMLAAAFGIDKADIDSVGIAVQHLIYNLTKVDGSWVAIDSTLPRGEKAAAYFQVLTADQKTAICETTDGLLKANVNNWAPYIMNLEAVAVDTLNGASVRISSADAKTGLRFKTVFNRGEVAALTGGKDFTVGTIIVPTDTLNGTAVTHEALQAADIKFLDVPATYSNPYASDDATVTIAGSIVGIKEANLGRDFTAVGYICVDGNYTYSASGTTTRNVEAVATLALADVRSNVFAEYVNVVSDGVYSPYTAAQRVMLSKLNGTYEA